MSTRTLWQRKAGYPVTKPVNFVSVAVENVTQGHPNRCSETQLARELGEKAALYGVDYGMNKRCDCEACTRAYHAGYSDGLERLR